jgi:hypothetical protein
VKTEIGLMQLGWSLKMVFLGSSRLVETFEDELHVLGVELLKSA